MSVSAQLGSLVSAPVGDYFVRRLSFIGTGKTGVAGSFV